MSTAAPTAAAPEAPSEVVNGQPSAAPAGGVQASWIASRLQSRLGPFAEDLLLGTVVTDLLFVLDRATGLRCRPDVAFVAAERWPLDQPPPSGDAWDVVPDLVVEVLTPADGMEDSVAKVGEYFGHGVKEVWVVLPRERHVYVYDTPTVVRVVAAPDNLETHLIPGWRLPLATLFRVPTPDTPSTSSRPPRPSGH
jgi:Uma2 family endonuclease